MSKSLPAGWAEASIGGICQPVSQRGPDRGKQTFSYIDLASIDNQAKTVVAPKLLRVEEAPSRAKQQVKSGDVLFSNVRVYLENIADVPEQLGDAIASTAFCVLRPAVGIESRYLYHYATSKPFVLEVNSLARGNSPPSVQDADVTSQTLPIPPTAEQKRIVSKIDELFSSIEEGERALERVRKLVEHYRQSVLKAAVTGELTREEREQNGDQLESGEALLTRLLEARRETWEQSELENMRSKGQRPSNDRWRNKYEEPAGPDATRLHRLPSGWVWASLGQIGQPSGGLTKNQRRAGHALIRPYLRVANVYTNRLDLDDVHEISVSEGELKRLTLQKNDLLVVEGNGSVGQIGRVALWDASISDCIHQNHIIKVRFRHDLLAWYALIWCMSPGGRALIEEVASTTAGLHTLSLSKVAALPIPLPTWQELELIRDEFERMESLVLTQQREIRGVAKTVNQLRQGVLKSAFLGSLVPHDPTDEPASVLLERIAAERATAAPKSRANKQPRKRKAQA